MRRYNRKGMNRMQKTKIEENSMECLQEQLKDYSGEIDVVDLAGKMGFQVGLAVMSDNEDGFIIIDDTTDSIQKMTGIKTDKLIGVNAKRNLQEKRFIIAHELGHYRLHYKDEVSDGMYAHRENRKGKDDKENEADFFAACLLMPQEIFKEKYMNWKAKDLAEDDIITLLQKHFNVPKESVERRITEVAEV